MPEETTIHIALLVASTILAAILGWLLRGHRSRQEKTAVNLGWQAQTDAQRTEHDRIVEQNKSLMEQVNQYQASNKDAKNRARELSEAVQEAFAKRDALQRDIKDIRSNLEVSLSERDQLQSSAAASSDLQETLFEKQTEIAKLRSDVASWQSRVAPLIERFRERNREAEDLQSQLDTARARIFELERELNFARADDVERQHDQTHIEPVRDPDTLTDGRDASNDPSDELGDGHRDKLQDIKGVGPAIEKTLNEMGIFRFQQIADMSEYDIDRVAQRLKGFHSRIYREDWIGQAREFCNHNTKH